MRNIWNVAIPNHFCSKCDMEISQANIFLFCYAIAGMKQYKIWNADWLTKFTKGEVVLSDLEFVNSTDVKVYKVDADGEPLRNELGNKVSYYLSEVRLKPLDAQTNAYENAGVLEKRVMDKTFTDEKLDLATDQIVQINAFNKSICELRVKLKDISDKLMAKVYALNDSVDNMDSEKFITIMKQIVDVTEFLDDKPMTYITELRDQLCGIKADEEYDPAEDLLGNDDD